MKETSKVIACGLLSTTALSMSASPAKADQYVPTNNLLGTSVMPLKQQLFEKQLAESRETRTEANPNILAPSPENTHPVAPTFSKIAETPNIEIANAEPARARDILTEITFENDRSSDKVNWRINADMRFQLNAVQSGLAETRTGENTHLIYTSVNIFEENGVEDVTNERLQIGLERKVDTVTISAGGGADFFNRLPAAPNAFANVIWQPQPNLFLFGNVTYEPYKFSAASLENNIRATRITPSIYWEIDEDTSLYSSFTWGSYSDGNQEQQTLANIERTFGNFFVGASVFYWNYNRDLDNGYFDPDSYWFYGGEVGWDGNITEGLSCRISAGLGEQRLEGESSSASAYKGECTAQVSTTFQASLGYEYSTLAEADNTSESSVISGEVRFTF